jgi:3-deoxy-D-arabino-heptulosonate 7-phosphate (DAHP) synthase class II
MHEQEAIHACGGHLEMIGQNVIKHVKGGKNLTFA